jgi:hypothetical protein
MARRGIQPSPKGWQWIYRVGNWQSLMSISLITFPNSVAAPRPFRRFRLSRDGSTASDRRGVAWIWVAARHLSARARRRVDILIRLSRVVPRLLRNDRFSRPCRCLRDQQAPPKSLRNADWRTKVETCCHHVEADAAWLEIILAATDLVAWTKLIGFTGHPQLASCEIATFRYRVLHVGARITRNARQIRLRIDATWRWATAISQGWQQLRAAFS